MAFKGTGSSSTILWKPKYNQEKNNEMKCIHSTPLLATLGTKCGNSNNLHGHSYSSTNKSKKVSQAFLGGNLFGERGSSSTSDYSPNEEEVEKQDDVIGKGIANQFYACKLG
jgi:hypothetical protein